VTIRAAATATAATQIPIFTADPSSTARTLVTRTPAELRSDIGAMPEPAGNGIVVRTGSQTSVNRTITGTGGAITSSPAGAGGGIIVTNGDGVSNNPTISLKSYSVAGPSSATNSWTIDHQLNSEALIVTLREVGANGEMVLADTIFLDSNRITFSFVNSQTANTLRVSVLRVD